MIILRVALDVPLPKLFDYRSEDATRADIGYRALVPFGTKRRVGVIVDVAAKSEVTDSRLRPGNIRNAAAHLTGSGFSEYDLGRSPRHFAHDVS